MNARPRLLFIEDSPDDSELLIKHLKRAQIAPHFLRVETAESIRKALQDEEWDAVICDYSLPQLNALDALSIIKAVKPELPCIIVSGSIGEEKAVETMKAGACEYLLKGNLIRLVPALEKALKDVELGKERRAIEASLRTSEENLRQAQKLESIGQLAGGIAHDFNNLLATILIQSEVLKEGLDPALSSNQLIEYVEKGVEQIIKSAERATNLTRQLLAFSRHQVLQPKTLNLNTLISDMQAMLRRVVEENIEFKIQLSTDLKNIRIDPGHLEQIIMNLVVNSRDAMPLGGRLEITTQNSQVDPATARSCNVSPGPHVLLTISDTGAGMSEEVKKRVFEPFFTTKPVGKGTGLGLSTVYGIVKQNKGLIFIESEVGKGSCFKLFFPITEGGTENHPKPEKVLATVKGTETILVVEDEEDLRELICHTLVNNGYNVIMAPTGVDALKQFHAAPSQIDLVLTDVVMPIMGGPELAKQVRLTNHRTKFLFQSGYTKEALVQSGLDESQIHFIAKPYPLKLLLQKIRRILD